MNIGEWTIDPARLWPGEAAWDGPVAFVDLDAAREVPAEVALPACPVIGLGDSSHPLAAALDAVVEPPVGADLLVRQILVAPQAAAVIVQLLRLLPALSVEQGLTAESLAYAVLQGSGEHLAWRGANIVGVAPAPGRLAVMREGARLMLTLDSPESGNAIDRAMRDALYEAFSLAALDTEIAAIELRANGKAFSLGAELGEFGTTTDPATAHAIRGRTLPARAAARCADRLAVHVQGACVGSGLELAAWARRVTASREAWFQLPELAMGILPGAGGCVSLSRRIGRQRTALMILSGKRIGAAQALGWGLVDEIA
ncbi:enoyl-CoA hydratase/isomerase family protein [Novosphingobium sp. G106]|uniref:enoyl-CoA hydratase/isomerase family protein n=1 Tax=Novosphingobium sp. G106 TaxID=2849500 RepID=UPI001C2CD471|nr:enoyl-CoA hydratase/isomerase family protein [Novosphingobium sp. G106]MBV1686859.1 enoyl-CoA hydratase/isomerase family protein [Novosphingobium sp. G106]